MTPDDPEDPAFAYARGVARQLSDDPDIPDDPEEEEPLPQAPSAADRGSQKRIRDKTRREAAEAKVFWSGIFASPVGRREIWAVLASCHAFDERFANGPNGYPQRDATWLQAGEQRAGFRLFRSWMKIVPDGVMLMLREHDPALKPPPKPPRKRRRPEEPWPLEDE